MRPGRHAAGWELRACSSAAGSPAQARRPRARADCPSAHLEGGRLPNVAGEDAQQQDAREARGGQQQRRQQRPHLPGHEWARGRTDGRGAGGGVAGARRPSSRAAGNTHGAGHGPRLAPPTRGPPRPRPPGLAAAAGEKHAGEPPGPPSTLRSSPPLILPVHLRPLTCLLL